MEDSEVKKLLEENLKLSKETHELVQKMVSLQRWARVFRIFYWAIIIGGSIGAYYLVQPYIQLVLGNYNAIMTGLDNIQKTTSNLQDSSIVDSILNGLKQGR